MTSPGRRTLDPDQMPSPIYVMEDDQKNNGGEFQTKEKGLVPPLVTTKFVSQDYGNATPRFVRLNKLYLIDHYSCKAFARHGKSVQKTH